MSFFFDDGNKSEPSDTFGAALKGIQQGLSLGMFIGKGFLLTSEVAQRALRARQEQVARQRLEQERREHQ